MRDPIVCVWILFQDFSTGLPWTSCVGSIKNIPGYPIVYTRILFRGFAIGSIEKIMGDPIVYARMLF